MKKRILSLLLVMLMVVSLVPTAALAENSIVAYEVTSGNIYFDSKHGKITDCDESVTIANIPSEISGTAVTSIGGSAFFGCTGLTSVTIPNSVTSIDYTAFSGCTSLTSINVEEDNASYGSDDGVLFNKEKTKLIAYPGGKIASSYTIPNGVTSIGDCAFYRCTSLTSVTIPNRVMSIGDRAFYRCTGLTSITIPDEVVSIGEGAFADCTSLASFNVSEDNKCFSSEDGVLFNKDKTRLEIYPQSDKKSEYTVPDGVTSINKYAFWQNKSLTILTLPTSIASLYGNVFGDLISLNKIIYKGTSEQLGEINIWLEETPNLGIFYLSRHADIHCADKIIHQLSGVVVPPTCTRQGYTHYECENCDYNYDDGIKAAFGHNYVAGECTRCGEKDPNAAAPSFVDVPSTSYCYDAVQWAVENGVTAGTDTTHFSPNAGCTRAQVVTFLWRAAGKPIVSANVSFTDVSSDAFYYEAVKWAVANGITAGTDAAHFSPNATCTRGQVATFLYRAAKSPSVSTVSSFSDVAAGSYCYNAVSWAVANGITAGTGGNRFSPNATCTRGQVVTFLYRAQ